MNKIKLGLTALAICAMQLLATAGTIGTGNIPPAVHSAFTRQYPGARVLGWENRNNEYIVNFRGQTESSSAYYTADGTWLRTDTKLNGKDELPQDVQEGLAKSTYGKYDIEQLDKIQQPSGKTVYMLRVDYGGDVQNEYLLYFNQAGDLETARHAADQQSPDQ